MIGKTLSHYKVIEKIGQGGMGEVYRAEDTNLSREVAIKVLPEQFTQDPQRLARFEREAKLLASLNHPNIAAIYGFEKAEGVHFLALELVPGETLAEKVAKGPVPVEEALEVCRQIAEGVEAAHEKGVIHRDLKPANVKVTPEGKVKILDFGLAKAFEKETPVTDISQSPTLTEEMTRAGVILGTAAYMSPEQARGEEVDKRADIFAFGCVLYELLTGKRAFEGKTITETIASVLKSEPGWETLPENTPWSIRTLLRRCLQKDIHQRKQHIDDARIEIEEALSAPATVSATAAAIPARTGWRRSIPLGLAALIALVVVVAVGTGVWTLKPSAPAAGLAMARLTVALPPGQQLPDQRRPTVALSPDGTQLAYVARQAGTERLYLRALDSLESNAISGSEGATDPFFSPDGQWVGFWANDAFLKVSVDERVPVKIADVPIGMRGAAWGRDGTIILGGANTGLHRVDAEGGVPLEITRPDSERGEQYHAWPEVLPDGKYVLFTAVTGETSDIGVLSLETGEWRILERTEGAGQPRYLNSGHLVFFRGGGLFAMPFDLSETELVGSAIPVLEDVFGGRNAGLYVGNFAVSRSGSLIYIPGGLGAGENRFVLVDREGREEVLPTEPRSYNYTPSVSPDGKWLAVVFAVRTSGDLWVLDLERGTLTRLTSQDANISPRWSADGTRVIFAAFKRDTGSFDLYWTLADGSGEPEPLLVRDYGQFPTSSSRDGRLLAFRESNPRTGQDIHVLSLEGDRTASPFLTTSADEQDASFSPEGRFLAYSSNESGQYEVYVQPFSGEGGKSTISTGGGRWPRWSPQGDELFYLRGSTMMGVSVELEPNFRAGSPRPLFEGQYTQYYDITPDGEHFVMVTRAQAELTEINVVLNWFEELKRLVPTP